MKSFWSTIALTGWFCLSSLSAAALTVPSIRHNAEDTELKDAYKALVNIITYRADGVVLHTGTGVFIDGNGTGAASYALFKDAVKADVIDYKGNKYAVARILGANSTYDLVKFSTVGSRKNEFLTVPDTMYFNVGAQLYLQHYTTNKKAKPETVTITQTDKYDKYKYLHTTAKNSTENFGTPLMDADGYLSAFVQQNVSTGDSTSCAIDARFLKDLNITPTSGMNEDLQAIGIPKGLPSSERDALTYIYMIRNNDSMAVVTAMNDFIAAYPDNAEGYTNRGAFFSDKKNYAACEQDFTTALTKAGNEQSTVKADEVHNELSNIIFKKAVYAPTPAYKDWTLERARREAETAFSVKPLPYYLLQQGRCLFAEKRYQEAHEKFMQLATYKDADERSWSDVAQAEAWFYAARSLEMAGGDSLKVIALLDSVIAKCPKPYTQSTAQYLVERGQRLQRATLYRRAVTDYNEYEKAIGPNNLSAQFYFIREQAELASRMYQQALDDIRTAQLRAPQESAYKIEEALILLRAGLFKDAINLCQKLLKDMPDSADCYKIMGIAHGESGEKTQAKTALQKAKALGDNTADRYLQQYQ